MRRIHQGLAQYKLGKRWRFRIIGFDGTCNVDGFCTCEGANGERVQVPIDAKDRILVQGRRYGRASWTH